MSLKRYMCIDLTILGAILCGLEFLNSLALQYFPGEVFTLSVVLPISLIVMMRWGAYGVLHAVVGGLVYCIFNQGGPSTYLIYTLGNACIALNLVWFRKIGKEAVRKSALYTVLFALSGYVAMNVGRAILAAVLEGMPFVALLVRYLSVETLSTVIGIVAVLIARRQNGLFEDQKHYLLRIQEEGRQHA